MSENKLLTRDELMDWIVQQRLIASERLDDFKASCFRFMRTMPPKEGNSRLDYLREARDDIREAVATMMRVDAELCEIESAMIDDDPWISDAEKHGMTNPCLPTGGDDGQ